MDIMLDSSNHKNIYDLFQKDINDLKLYLYLKFEYANKLMNMYFQKINIDYLFELSKFYIPETYLIAIVLSFITLLLWCMLYCKKKKMKSEGMTHQNRSSTNNSININTSNGQSKQSIKTHYSSKQQKHNSSNDDGYLSDSALSFFSSLKTNSGPRFRKRDKLFFYGKKMLRTVSNVKGNISARSAEKSKDIYKIITKKILNTMKNDDSIPPLYRRTDPPQFLLDIENENQKDDHDLPSALINLIRSVKVFGYFDQKIILEMCKYMETRTVYANNYLFKIGDSDDSIYVVESGKVNVYITDEKGRKHLIKECTEGNHIFSLLSIMEVLTGEIKPYKTVSAKAVEDTSILRLPGKAFVDVLQKYPEYLVRITQIIIVRLQRVTFTALHNYLGLTSEIIGSERTRRKKKTSKNFDKSYYSTERTNISSSMNTEPQSINTSANNSDLIVNNSNNDHNHNSSHHHHHHHYHHYHPKKHNGKHASSSNQQSLPLPTTKRLDSFEESGSDTQYYYKNNRKYSIPLPPVGFFQETAEDTDDPSERKIIKSKSSPIRIEAIQNNESQVINETVKNSLNNETVNEEKISSKYDNSNDKNLFMASSVNSYEDILETTSSDGEKSEGSEFGDGNNSNNTLYKKLPQIEVTIAQMLKLSNPSILKDKIDLFRVSESTILCKEGDFNCGLIFVLEGLLNATQKDLNGDESSMFKCHPNQFCGNLSVISGEPSLFTIRAKQDTDIAVISKDNFHKIIRHEPIIVLSVANFIVKRMSPFVRQIDFALEWNLIESGSALFRQNVKAENIYIVLNGRLRSILKTSDSTNNNKQLVGEYGRGDLVGLVEILMETNNATTVVAIRDTEVAQIPSGLLNYIKYRHPRVVTRLIQMLSSKLLGTIQNTPSTPYIDASYSLKQPIDAPTIVSNLCTVAIMPVSDDVPLHAFTMQLSHALSAIDNTLLLTKDLIVNKLGPSALERVNEYRLCAWLGQQEDHHRIVLYQCEYKLTPWTRRCMRQADCLLIVGLASNEPTVGQLEKEIDNFAIRAQKELILLHKMDGSRPKNTVRWLNMRNWCTSHHHIRCPDSVFKAGTNERHIKLFQADLNNQKVDKMTDFSRLARFLTGTSIGVVLGGGGARGSAHVGMIKAMIEANIPIDMIGGTSIGSFMGALWAEENNFENFERRAREWAMKMTSYYRQILDLTYPFTSMFTGAAFNRSIEDVFCNRQIEDLWIPYFCVTTDISASKMRLHMNGLLWRYVRASMTYCWLFPPMCDPFDGHLLVDGCYVNNVPGCLWRYVRSSMSLSGYLPPLCDPIDGHLLLDGGYVNNLPADVMHRMGVNTVLAIDVGTKDDDNFTNYGDELSGWWLLWKKWNHWARPVKVPDLTEIQSRLAYVSCQRGLEIVKNSDYCNYMRPPIDKFRTLQFGSFDEIKDVGYHYGKILFDTWIKHGGSIEKFLYKKNSKKFMKGFSNDKSPQTDRDNSRPRLNRLASIGGNHPNKYHFEDLSQFVTTIQRNQQQSNQEKPTNSILKSNSNSRIKIEETKSKGVELQKDKQFYDKLRLKGRNKSNSALSLDQSNDLDDYEDEEDEEEDEEDREDELNHFLFNNEKNYGESSDYMIENTFSIEKHKNINKSTPLSSVKKDETNDEFIVNNKPRKFS